MSIMVDQRPETAKSGLTPSVDGGPFVSLVKGRFVLAGGVIATALRLGFGSEGLVGPGDGAVGRMPPELRLDPNTAPPEV